MAPSASLSAFEAADRLHKWVRVGKSFSGGERNNCFLNLGNSHFADVSGSSGFDTPDDARAVGLTDWDHDGDWDLWVANRNGPQLRFFQNHSERHGKSVMLSLVGTKCNRDAIGARVVGTLQKANENNNKPKQLIRTVRAGDGYLSQSSKLIHFGLGATAENVHIVVHWPSGDQQDYGVLKPGRYRLTQDDFSPIALSSLTTPHSLPAVTSQGLVSHDGRVASDTGRTVLASRIPVPKLAYRSSQPSEQSLSLKNGQPTLIHLWATWCDPCLQELGEHIRHANDLNAANLRVVVLSVPEPESNSRASYAQVLEKLKNSFEAGEATEATLDVLQVVHNHVFDRHRPLPVPTSFLFDRGGELAVIYKGPVTSEQLVADIKLLDHDVTKRRLASVPFVGRWHGPLGKLRLEPLAVALAESGHLDVAVRYARQHRDRVQPRTLARLLARVGNELYRDDKITEAVAQYEEAIRVDPAYAPAHLNLAVALLRNREWRDAEQELLLAIKHDPNYPQAHFQLGMLQLRVGQQELALGHLMTAVKHKPRDAKYRLTLANVLMRAQKAQEAIGHLQSVIRFQPDNTAAWGMLGTVYLGLGDELQAVKSFEEIVQRQPDFPPALGDLARILATAKDAQLRDSVRAVRLAEHACQLENRQNPRRLLVLAEAYLSAQRRSDAQKTLQIALTLAEKVGDQRLISEIRHRLEWVVAPFQ